MAPGPALAILADGAWRDGLGRLDDDQLTGMLQAAARLASWSAALKLAATSGSPPAAKLTGTGAGTGGRLIMSMMRSRWR